MIGRSDEINGIKSAPPGLGRGSSGRISESRTPESPRRRRRPLPWREDLDHEPLRGADLGTAEDEWLLAVASRSAEWFQHMTGVEWTPAGRAFFLGRLTGICRHWSDPSGHGLNRGWHLDASERAPWTSKKEREICWPQLDPRPVCRRQSDAVTRLVLGTPSCPGHFDLTRGALDTGGQVSLRLVLSWATAIYLCDPVAATTATNARYQKVRTGAARHYAERSPDRPWELDHRQLRDLLLSA